VAKLDHIELGNPDSPLCIPILYEDRAVLAIDKPAGWMLAPTDWQNTGRNLAAAILSSVEARDFWARSRNVKFLRFVHRIDAETTGIVLFVKSQGAIKPFSELFEGRAVDKTYLAVVEGVPKEKQWVCQLPLGQEPSREGRIQVDFRQGRPAETHFQLLETRAGRSLVEAHPLTGRTHQIRIHLAQAGHPVVGDWLYGKNLTLKAPMVRRGQPVEAVPRPVYPMGLRAVVLAYTDPFIHRPVRIVAPTADFEATFGFAAPATRPSGQIPK
jgi:23S rRNA pseudouridine1911/1915/1917 synthase